MKFGLHFWKLNTQYYSIDNINELFSIHIFLFYPQKYLSTPTPQFQVPVCPVSCGLRSVLSDAAKLFLVASLFSTEFKLPF